MESTKQRIIDTLIYSDLFAYPLTYQELYDFLHTEKKVPVKRFLSEIKRLQQEGLITCGKLYVCLKGRERVTKTRKYREKESEKKMAMLVPIITSLRRVPTIRFIGVSGSLSMQNAKRDDDIDLFIVTEHKKIWVTRFLVWLFLTALGVMRKRKEHNTGNTVCANMFVDAGHLQFSSDRQTLYTAHELLQMQPVFERHGTYRMLHQKNAWTHRFLAHATPKILPPEFQTSRHYRSLLAAFLQGFVHLPFVEFFAKAFQLWYMKGHVTQETVSDTLLAFHPIAYGDTIAKRYERRLRARQRRMVSETDESLWIHSII